MTPDQTTALFTRPDGSFLCARWGRPVAPVVFGLDNASLAVFRGAMIAGLTHAGIAVTETDAQMGANLMVFAVQDWAELAGIPDLDHLTGIDDLPGRLQGTGAHQYYLFRFDADGSIRAAFVFLRISGPAADIHPAQLGELVATNVALTFAAPVVPSPDLAALIRAAYDPVLPVAATDASHAIRLAARA